MPWLKYRHKFASGTGSWEWKFIESGPAEADLEDYASNLAQAYNWSDKYRGIDYHLVELPPRWVLDRFIRQNDAMFREAERRAAEFDNLLPKAKVCKTCRDCAPVTSPPRMLGRTYDCEECGRMAVRFEPYPTERKRS